MKPRPLLRFVLIAALALGPTLSLGAPAAASPTLAPSAAGPEVSAAVHHDVSPPLRDLPEQVEQRGQFENPRYPVPHQTGNAPASSPAIQPGVPTTGSPTLGVNFDGVGVGLGAYADCCAPPDPNGDVGPNHYVQMVNLDYAIFSKTGTLLLAGLAPRAQHVQVDRTVEYFLLG